MSAIVANPWRRAAEHAQFVLLALNLAWTTVCLGGYRAETRLASFALGAALAAVHLGWRLLGAGPGIRGSDMLLAAFLGCGLVNILAASPAPWLGWPDWCGWAQLALAYWVARDVFAGGRRATALRVVLALVAAAAVAMALYQRLADPGWLMLGRRQAEQFLGRSSGCFGIPNSLAALMLLTLPAAAAAAMRRRASPVERVVLGYAALVFAAGLCLSVSRGAWLALGLVLACRPLFLRGRAWSRRLVLAGAALAGVVAATALFLTASPSARDRAERFVAEAGERSRPILWRAALGIFAEHPMLGGGAGCYDLHFEAFRPASFQDDPQWAHNEYLNTLADYGLAGLLLLGGAAAIAVAESAPRDEPGDRVGARDRALEAGSAIGLAAFLVQAFVDFHFKLPGLALAFGVTAGLWSGGRRAARAGATEGGAGWVRRSWERHAWALALGGGLVVFLGGALPILRAEAVRYAARRELDRIAAHDVADAERRAVVQASLASMREAVQRGPGDAPAWADLSFALALEARERPEAMQGLGREAEAAARRSLALSKLPYETWLRLGVALDMQGRWADGGEALGEAIARAPNAAMPRYYLAYHFAQRKGTVALARALIDTCLRLDPANAAAQALRRRLAGGEAVR